MTDDELSDVLLASIPKTSKILVISDCCHSGTLTDFNKPSWRGRQAISISGCRDTQTSGDTGNGGICTHAILLAVESLQCKGETRYSVGKLFNETLRKDDEVFNSPQDITIDSAVGFKQNDMDWPLVPKSQYTAPHSQGAGAGMADGPAPANTYTLHSSAAAPAVATYTNGSSIVAAPATYTNGSSIVAAPTIYTNGSSIVAAPATYTNGSSIVAAPATYTNGPSFVAPAVYVTPNSVPGNSSAAHVTHSVPGNSYYLPSTMHTGVSVSHVSTPYVMQQNAAYSVTPSHYVAQVPGAQPTTTHLTVSQPVYPGPCATPVHTGHITLQPQVVTNFAPGAGSASLSPAPWGNVPHMPFSTGVSIEIPSPHLACGK